MLKKNCTCECEFKDGILEVVLAGEIDHHSAVGVRSGIDAKIFELRPKKTVIDLSNIDFMDSSGLGLIMGRYALMQKTGGEFSLKNPGPRIVKIFNLAGLSRIIKTETDKKDE